MSLAAETEEQRAHVLVVDDDRRIRTLLQRYLSENGYRVSVAENAADARARLDGLQFDLIVLDVMMPGEDGLALTSALRQRSTVPILLLTAKSNTEDRIEGLERGADDYLSKPFEPKELLLRVGRILARAAPSRQALGEVRFGKCVFNIDRGELRLGEEPVHLTAREVAMLQMFALNAGKPLSREELSEPGAEAAERAVDVQINRLRRKIEDDPKNPLHLQTVRGMGYVLRAEPG